MYAQRSSILALIAAAAVGIAVSTATASAGDRDHYRDYDYGHGYNWHKWLGDRDHDYDHGYDWHKWLGYRHYYDRDYDRPYYVAPPPVRPYVVHPVAADPSPPANCLRKDYLQGGAVLFKDTCTGESAMNPPAQGSPSR